VEETRVHDKHFDRFLLILLPVRKKDSICSHWRHGLS